MRTNLSTYINGSFLPVSFLQRTLVHVEDTSSNVKYIRVVGFNVGKRQRNVVFSFNNVNAIWASVQPTGNPQILLPDIPVYNSGNGVKIDISMDHGIDAWQFPNDIANIVAVEDGRVIGVSTLNIMATSNAQPVIVHVEDSMRSNTDIDPLKGSEAIVELYQIDGIVRVDILNQGYGLTSDNLSVQVLTGVYFYGDIFSD